VELAIRIEDQQMADTNLNLLAKLSDESSDTLIETAYQGAAGALLFSGQDYKDAILHLEQDIHNPLSMNLLVIASRKIGDNTEAREISDALANMNDPTLEQAMIVPAFRNCLQHAPCDTIITSVSLQH
jgi:hypothetical protein